MAIVVSPMGRIFRIEISHEEEKISFDFKQLDYKTKAKITSLVTSVEKGQLQIDAALQVFFNLKHGLKAVSGLTDENGNTYALKFEDAKKTELTDDCVDELLATVLSDNLQYSARALSGSVMPTEIVHPLTQKKIEGVEVIPPSELKGVTKK